MTNLLRLAVVASLAMAPALAVARSPSQRPMQFSIENRDLRDALTEWSRQSGYRIGSPIKEDIVAPRVKGRYTPRAALERLLEGTSLKIVWGEEFVSIVKSAEPAPAKPLPTRVAKPSEAPSKPADDLQWLPRGRDKVEEVVVTGTHVRGTMESAYSLKSYDLAHIDAMLGIPSLLEFMSQNFGGGASAPSLTGAGDSNNVVDGCGINLRGLGNQATLVLVNGHRIAPASVLGNFTDLCMIPQMAVERVEVVLDSASAIYGSDAVGGVVNFVLRRDFSGAETWAGHAFVAHGDSAQTQVAQTLGSEWDSGSVLASYEYLYRSPLDAQDRWYARQAREPITLLPKQARSSLFFSIEQEVSSTVELFADAVYSHRASYMEIGRAHV